MTSRVGYLCGEYPRATDTFIQREVAALRAAGIEVETISVRQPPVGEQGTEEQVAERSRTRYLLPCNPFRLVADHSLNVFRSPLRYGRSIWLALTVRSPGIKSLIYQMFYFAEAGMLAAHVRRQALSHVHNHAPDASGYVALIAAQMGGFTYSLTLHGFGILSEPKRWRLTEKLERSLFAICVSWHARSQAMLWTDPVHWPRFHVVHCGIEPAHCLDRKHENQGQRLLFVGRLDRVKGLPVLLDALRALHRTRPGVHLDIVGDGPERSRLEATVRELDLDDAVTFRGYLSQGELRAFLKSADVMVLASFAEGVPVVLMEAMAQGLPVIAPRITGIPELVQDGVNGRLTTPGCSDELARSVEELLNDANLRHRFAVAAFETVQQEFDVRKEAQKLVEIMRRRLQNQHAAIRPANEATESVEQSVREAAVALEPAK